MIESDIARGISVGDYVLKYGFLPSHRIENAMLTLIGSQNESLENLISRLPKEPEEFVRVYASEGAFHSSYAPGLRGIGGEELVVDAMRARSKLRTVDPTYMRLQQRSSPFEPTVEELVPMLSAFEAYHESLSAKDRYRLNGLWNVSKV